MAEYTPQQQTIINEAMGTGAASTLSPDALYYRSYGTFKPTEPVTATTDRLNVMSTPQINGPVEPIPASQITPTSPLVPPPPATDTTNFSAVLAGLQGSLPEPVNPELENKKLGQKAVIDQLTALEGEGAYRMQMEQELGLPEQQKQLRDLQSQLTSINYEAAAQTLQLDDTGRPARLQAGKALEATNIERGRTVQALRLSASIQAVQGNVELAMAQVNRAVEMKYAPMKARLETLKTQLEFTYDAFDSAEKKIADAMNRAYDERARQLDIQMTQEKQFEEVRLNALMGGMDSTIAAQADALFKAGDLNGAYSLLSKYAPRDTSGMTSSLKEYEYAVSQGYTGTFQQWEDRNRKTSGSGSGGGGSYSSGYYSTSTPTSTFSASTPSFWEYAKANTTPDQYSLLQMYQGSADMKRLQAEYEAKYGTSATTAKTGTTTSITIDPAAFKSLTSFKNALGQAKLAGYSRAEVEDAIEAAGKNPANYTTELNSIFGGGEDDLAMPVWND